MSPNHRLVVALVLCVFVCAIGASGYVLIEDYTIPEALYMCVITLSTVGFEEVKPLSASGRVFTAFLIIVGIGSIAFASHAFVESLLKKVWSGRSEIRKMKREISRLKSHYIICGYGRVGEAAAEYLKKEHTNFVIIEAKKEQTREIQEKGYFVIEGDATRETVLQEAGVKSASGLLALLNSDPDNLFLVLTARELNPTLHIIARAEEASSEKKIYRAGADNVTSPFTTAGRQIAGDILAATGKLKESSEDLAFSKAVPQWVTVHDGSSMRGETIKMVSNQMGKEILGLRRNGHDNILPDSGIILESSDMLLVMDEERDSENRFDQHQPEPQKLVIVDDNPIILRLYARLFQKAGFTPMTATDGRKGLDLIIEEKPMVAVIDYMLPILSGIELCERIRAIEACKDIRLIIFTADNHPETQKRALQAGADAVVIKSPEASEVISTVIEVIKKDQRQFESTKELVHQSSV